jgi:hypothetical protein
MIQDMLSYYNMLHNSNINIIYSGPIWSDGIEGIGGTLRKCFEFDDLPLSAAQSVFSVFVEQMNNILMYSTDKDFSAAEGDKACGASKGVFILGSKDRSYFLQSGNVMKNENVELIRSRLEFLNSLDKAALRKYYKEQMRSADDNSESRGGGLGLIEIARRASSKIEYSFTPLGEGLTFFSMFVTIS